MSETDRLARFVDSLRTRLIADSSQAGPSGTGSDSGSNRGYDHGLSDPSHVSSAELRSRDAGILAGSAWFDALLRSADSHARIDWALADGQRIRAGMTLAWLQTSASALAQSREMMTILALMSGTASSAHEYVERVKGTHTDIYVTRHALPDLRDLQLAAAQSAGVVVDDGLVLALNAVHCTTAGSVAAAVAHARQQHPDARINLEVTSLELLDAGLEAGVDAVVLTGLASHVLARAVNMADAHRRRFCSHLQIQATGDITLANIREIADTGVDRIRVPALTNQLRTLLFDLVLI